MLQHLCKSFQSTHPLHRADLTQGNVNVRFNIPVSQYDCSFRWRWGNNAQYLWLHVMASNCKTYLLACYGVSKLAKFCEILKSASASIGQLFNMVNKCSLAGLTNLQLLVVILLPVFTRTVAQFLSLTPYYSYCIFITVLRFKVLWWTQSHK